MLDILRNNPFPKFHIDPKGKVSLFVKERRVPVKVTVDQINKMIPKRMRRAHEASNGFTISTGVTRDGNSVILHDIVETEPRESYRFQSCSAGYTYRFYSGRTATISKSCGAKLFTNDNPNVTRQEIISFLVKYNYGIEI